MPSDKQIVIFDFDGVIVGTFEMCLKIKQLTNPELDAASYRQMFEGNINKAVKQLPTNPLGLALNFWSQYTPQLMQRAPIPGMPEVITSLANSFSLAIVSSTITAAIEQYLTLYNLRHYFSDILGNDIDFNKAKKFQMIFDRYHTSSGQCLYITDTLGDLHEAAQVQLPAIGVTWGYHSKETLEQGRSVAIIDSPSALVSAIQLRYS